MNLILIVVISAISLKGFSDQALKYKLIHNPYIVNFRKEYFRLITSGFIHADLMHLFLNMYAMYIFGDVVEDYFKVLFGQYANIYYLALFILGVIVANIPDYLQKKNMPQYNSLGASGGVSSVVFASIILAPLNKLMMFPIPIPMPAYIFAMIYLAYSFYMEKRQGDNINHLAHIWGGIWGVIFMFISFPNSLPMFIEQIKSSFL